MKKLLALLVVVAALSLSTVALFAHHGRGATYARNEITLKGTIKDFHWRNPHVAIFVDVPDATGKVTTWAIEHSNVSSLARRGYTRNTLQPGQPVTVHVNPAANGSPQGLCRKIVLPDGKEIFQRGGPEDID
jgi:hypothetical protein